jgi:C-terminal processing protease CtpA/Prc
MSQMLKRLLVGFLTIAGWALAQAAAQNPFDNLQKDRARQMLKDLADGVRKHYYDPKFHGVDLEARIKTADERIRNAASLGQAFAAIANVLDALNDSHTFFVPPARNVRREYGYEEQMIGDRCFVTAVRPGGPANEKLTPGDEVIEWEGAAPARDTLWKMTYMFNQLYSLPIQHLVVRGPGGAERKVEITAREHQEKRVLDLTNGDGDIWQLMRDEENSEHMTRQRISEFSDKLMVWKMPEFELTDEEVDRILKQARRYPFLAIDLRGNPGGLIKTLQYIAGGVMDHDVTIAKRTGRKPDLKPITARARGSAAFSGKLLVLIDSRSASAAEIFARVMQLEHRGTVLGDHSSGSVMESLYYPWHQGVDTQFYYGASITEADLVMGDGKSLEHTGVIPDELILPSPEDLEMERDPVLSRVAKLAGLDLDPVAAGKLFPVEWKKE